MLIKNNVFTLTTCFRKDIFEKYLNENLEKILIWKQGDLPLWLWIRKNYKIKFLNEITAVYRILEESAIHTKNLFKSWEMCLSRNDILKYYCNKYNISKNVLKL